MFGSKMLRSLSRLNDLVMVFGMDLRRKRLEAPRRRKWNEGGITNTILAEHGG